MGQTKIPIREPEAYRACSRNRKEHMFKNIFFIIVLTLAVSGLSSCSSSSASVNQSALEVEEQVLSAAAASLSWEFPQQLVLADTPPGVIYRESQLVMVGAEDVVEIIRYPTEEEALAAFDSLEGLVAEDFHTMAAKIGGRTAFDESSAHYQGLRWFAWLYEERIFRVITGYNSMIAGETRDPLEIAEILYTNAVAQNLLPPFDK